MNLVANTTRVGRMAFFKVPVGASFVFASAPDDRPFTKDSVDSYLTGAGASVQVEDRSVQCQLKPVRLRNEYGEASDGSGGGGGAGAGVDQIVFPSNTLSGTLTISSTSGITGLLLPGLESIGAAGVLTISGASITVVDTTALTSVAGTLTVQNTGIAAFNLANATIASGAVINVKNNTGLLSVFFANGSFQGPVTLDLSGNALTSLGVGSLLHAAVLSPLFTGGGSINISGGTSAAPTGQAATDKATLQGRGITVTTN